MTETERQIISTIEKFTLEQTDNPERQDDKLFTEALGHICALLAIYYSNKAMIMGGERP